MRDWRPLYDFLFGVPGTPSAKLTSRLPLWFLKSSESDMTARRDFAPWLDEYDRGELDGWKATPRGTLSLVVLLDQVSRNAFRGRPESFAHDPQALAVALDAIERGWDRELTLLERIFLYLPIEHSESLPMQQLSVRKFEALHEEAPPELADFTRLVLDYALKHREVIERFGRYPHRNAILGRPGTDEEEAFLRLPGSAF